jgi:hypothetical protein
MPDHIQKNEVRLLLYLAFGGAFCLAVMAGVGVYLVQADNSPPQENQVPLAAIPGEPEIMPMPALEREVQAIAAGAGGEAIPDLAPPPALLVLEEGPRPLAVTPLPVQQAQPGPVAQNTTVKEEPLAPGCDKLGTRIVFHKNPPDAFKEAKEQKKLVLMIHLSGIFEDKEFT